MKFKLPKTSLLLFLVLFLASAGVFLFLLGEVESKKRETIALRGEWLAEKSKRDNIENLATFMERYQQDIGELESHFVTSKDVVSFLDLMEGLGNKVGATSEVTLIDVPKDQSYLTVEIKASGNFESIYKFISLLENSPYELEIMSMRMDSNSQTEGQNSWSSVLKIKLLSFVQE
jgi:Tfp pilus assembly protein PilO